MRSLEGCSALKLLHRSAESEVYLATRDRDGLAVVLKWVLEDRAHDSASRARRELEVLRELPPGTAVRALDLERSGSNSVLVLEPFRGAPVRPLLEPSTFLEFAVRAAAALYALHTRRWVHRNLTPEHLLFDPQSGGVRLAGFSRAAPLGAPDDPRTAAGGGSGLRYMAPEQSGRMNRGVDFRSDLYSLGAVFCELLTGTAPFDHSDPLALVHAHMARRPPSLLERRPELPSTLSRIVLRLLEKEPENRYQTAYALEVDLASCREQLERVGRIDDDLPLGTADAPFRPLFRRTLYGREADLQVLLDACQRAERGATELVLLSGAPGIGKSALLLELHRPLALMGGYLAQGKFDLYRRQLPYSGFVSVLHSLAQQILTESDDRLQSWRVALCGELGNLAAVVAEWVPDLGVVLGDLPAAPTLGSKETQQRLALAVQRLIRGLAEHAPPLVLFLDDLQWADPGSLYLLEELLAPGKQLPLLLVCAYRDNEVDTTPGFRRVLEHIAEPRAHVIELKPLSLEATTQMLGDALGCEPERARSLAALVARKSGSNPLLIQQCVYHLHKLGAIRYQHPRGWSWEDESIAAAQIPDDAVGMMVAKLNRLPAEPRDVMALASCVGDGFSVDVLLELCEGERRSLESALHALSVEGLIAPSAEGFRFVHDRIREAAQALHTAEQRAELHHRMGVMLLAKIPAELRAARVFEIVDHLNRAAEYLSEEERSQALALNVAAARTAHAAGAAATASSYFERAHALFREDDWQRDSLLSFSLFFGSAESAYQIDDAGRAQQWLAVLEARALEPGQSLQVLCARIRVVVQNDWRGALDLTLGGLRRVGVRLPRKPSQLRLRYEVWCMDRLLRSVLSGKRRATTAPDARAQMALVLIGAGGYALERGGVGLIFLGVAHCLRFFQRHGLPLSGFALTAYAAYRSGILGELREITSYARAAEDLLARRGVAQPTEACALFELWYLLHGWTEPRQKTAEGLIGAIVATAETGQREYCTYSLGAYTTYLLVSGEPLDFAISRIEAVARESFPGVHPYLHRMLGAYALLRREDPEPVDWVAELPVPCADTIQSYLAVIWIFVLGHAGAYEHAAAHTDSIEEIMFACSSPGGHLLDFSLIHGVSHAALAGSSVNSVRKRHVRILERCHQRLRRWARHASDAVGMAQMLEAERAQLAGQYPAALRLYQTSAESFRKRGLRQYTALAHERRAELLHSLRRHGEAEASLATSLSLYKEWGARAKVSALRRRAEELGLELRS